jgi:hypothetical protein
MPIPDQIAQVIRDRAQAYGIDPTLLARVAQVESNYNPQAGASTSSAKGLFQFTDPTWRQYGQGRSVYDPYANADAGARFTQANIQGLQAAGQPVSPGNVYLAHFAGLGGARSVLGADPSTPVSRVLDPAALKANPFLRGMTVGDLRGWAAAKMGGQFDPATPAASGTSGDPSSQPAAAPSGTTAPVLNDAQPEGLSTGEDQAPPVEDNRAANALAGIAKLPGLLSQGDVEAPAPGSLIAPGMQSPLVKMLRDAKMKEALARIASVRQGRTA